MSQPSIPRYALYGEFGLNDWGGMVHVERIRQRSSLYDFTIEPHAHDAFLQLLRLESGGGETDMDGRRWNLTARSIIIVPARCVHAFRFTSDTDGTVVTAAQAPLEALAAATTPNLLPILRQPAVLDAPASARLATAIELSLAALASEARDGMPGPVAAGALLLLATFAQIARLPKGTIGDFSHRRSRRQTIVERFRTLIEDRYRAAISINHAAAELGITAGQLTRICRETLGQSSRDLINGRIMREAERELIYTDASVKQIAASLGFADDAYFGRFFRRQSGTTPTAFRQAARSRLADVTRGDP